LVKSNIYEGKPLVAVYVEVNYDKIGKGILNTFWSSARQIHFMGIIWQKWLL
jgi:hypothetical protein